MAIQILLSFKLHVVSPTYNLLVDFCIYSLNPIIL